MKELTKEEIELLELAVNNVCNEFNVTEVELLSKSRIKRIMDAKNILYFITYKKYDISLFSLARYFNFTVQNIWANAKAVQGLMDVDEEYKEKVERLFLTNLIV